MIPASAPSCCAQGVTAASYSEYAIRVSPSVELMGETIGEAGSSCQQARGRAWVGIARRTRDATHVVEPARRTQRHRDMFRKNRRLDLRGKVAVIFHIPRPGVLLRG